MCDVALVGWVEPCEAHRCETPNTGGPRSTRPTLRLAIVLSLLICRAVEGAEVKPTAEQVEFFEKSVRPVLVTRCGKCHGEKVAEGGLRLDTKAGLAHGIEGAPVVAAGNVDSSRLIQVVRFDRDVQMPPDGKLPAAEIATLERWVQQGAFWPGEDSVKPAAVATKDWPMRIAEAKAAHWSFRPIQKPTVPQVKNSAWCQTPIDAFILQKLEQAGLQPSPRTDARTLLRRASYDLTGLPPSTEQAKDFVSQFSPSPALQVSRSGLQDNETWRQGEAENINFTSLVETLLSSPHYGERWGRHWLDIARYADTKGYAFQNDRRYPYAYTYRDYVIEAFNRDLPFDQFVIEQLAADRLPTREDNRHLAALGFLTVGRRIGIHDDIDDRIDVVSRGLLGLSLACARCHDHKYDAIPADDYYSLYGVFRSSTEPGELPLLCEPEPSVEYVAFKTELDKRQAVYDVEFEKESAKLSDQLRTHVGDYLADIIIEARDKGAVGEYRYLVGDPTTATVRHWKEFLKHSANKPDAVFGLWHRLAKLPNESFAGDAERLVATIREGKQNWPINPRLREALLKHPPAKPLDAARLYDEVFEGVRGDRKNQDPAAQELRQVLYGDSSPAVLTKQQAEGLLSQGAKTRLTTFEKKVDEWLAAGPGAPARAMTLVDSGDPFKPYVFLRGNPGLRGKNVPRQFVGLASAEERKPFTDGSGRLELAQAIVDPRNPLTARVIVNRVWQHHFGQGLVRTPSDYGVRGEPPTHPELLDYLASWFVENGWSLKKLHRLIMNSTVYQQSSISDFGLRISDSKNASPNPQSAIRNPQLIDPDNRLLWRMNRQRLEFEAIRDSMLVAAGRLDPTMGGRAVDLTKQPFTTRRTVYGYIDRQDLPDLFRTFDFASPDVSTEQRPQTTVPQQALFEMNAPFVIEQAREIVKGVRAKSPAGSDTAMIDLLYGKILGRSPDESELQAARQFIASAEKQPPPTPIWQYGYGRFDNTNQQVAKFTSFAHYSGKQWQPSSQFPDSKLGHVTLRPNGGHPGANPDVMVILRWTSPISGEVVVDGELIHDNAQGDGVQARVVGPGGVHGSWMVAKNRQTTKTDPITVNAGDKLDLVVDCRDNTNSDSYTWRPIIRELGGSDSEWNAEKEFHGPTTPPLAPWEMLAQVLLLTNEALFVD